MKKFIIIDTFNGEGYSDSTAVIKEFEDNQEARDHCQEQALINSSELTEYDDGFGYEMDDDAGAFKFVELTEDIIGVRLNPCINEYDLIKSERELDDMREFAYEHGDLDSLEEDEVEGLRTGESFDGLYIHGGKACDGDAVFFLFDEGEEEPTVEAIAEAAQKLIEAIIDNQSSLWNPDLECTTECIIMHESEIVEDLDNPEDVTEYSGINKEMEALEKLLKLLPNNE